MPRCTSVLTILSPASLKRLRNFWSVLVPRQRPPQVCEGCEADKPGDTAVLLVKHVVGGIGYVLLDHNHPAVFAYTPSAPL